MQRQVTARIQNAVLQNHDIIACGRIFVVCMYADIAVGGLGLAVHGNNAVFGIQRDILISHQGGVVGSVMADGDTALSGFNIDAAAGRGYSMDFHATFTTLAHGHIAFRGRQRYIPADHHVPAEFDIALVFYNNIQVPLRYSIIRYLDSTVPGVQGQVTGGKQLAVLGDHDVFIIVFVDGMDGDIAFLGLGGAIDRNDAIPYIHINVFFGGNRVA